LSDRLEFQEKPGGCARGLGVITFLVNGGMTAAGVLLVARGSIGGLALAGLGGMGVLFGLALMLGSYAAHLDRGRRELVRTWRVGVTLRRRETPIDGCSAVVLRNHAQRLRYGWVRYHVVSLARPEGEVFLRRRNDEDEAIAFAEEVAAFLPLPLKDERRPTAELQAERSPLGARGRTIVVVVTLVTVLMLMAVVGLVVAMGRMQRDDRDHRDKPKRRGAVAAAARQARV
jgi:hypothetical protein